MTYPLRSGWQSKTPQIPCPWNPLQSQANWTAGPSRPTSNPSSQRTPPSPPSPVHAIVPELFFFFCLFIFLGPHGVAYGGSLARGLLSPCFIGSFPKKRRQCPPAQRVQAAKTPPSSSSLLHSRQKSDSQLSGRGGDRRAQVWGSFSSLGQIHRLLWCLEKEVPSHCYAGGGDRWVDTWHQSGGQPAGEGGRGYLSRVSERATS